MKGLYAMNQAPLYPFDEKVYICSLHFGGNCFEWDLNKHFILAIGYNQRFCLFALHVIFC